MTRPTTSLLLTLALACSTGKSTTEPGDTDTTGGGGADGSDDEIGHGDGDDGDDGSGFQSACPYEAPPTRFTSGLVELVVEAPDGGEFSLDYTGRRIVQTAGTVDWDAGTLESTSSYVDGYTQLSHSVVAEFVLDGNGDSETAGTTTRIELSGAEHSTEFSAIKTGCTTVRQTEVTETGEHGTWTGTLVSAARLEWTFEVVNAGGSGWTYSSVGADTDDWTTHYTFETDDPTSAVSPDRLGDCVVQGDGDTTCTMTQYRSATQYSTGTHAEALNGDRMVEFENFDEDMDPILREWGTDSRSYAGDGWRQWTLLDFSTNREVSCDASWDEDGLGAWSCDNGASGTYP